MNNMRLLRDLLTVITFLLLVVDWIVFRGK